MCVCGGGGLRTKKLNSQVLGATELQMGSECQLNDFWLTANCFWLQLRC